MASQIDHIVIAVNDLETASKDYAQAGFTVTPGGEHTSGVTHNALVSFADGAYFELIAFKNPGEEPQQPHRWWSKLRKREGLVDYALLSADLGEEANALTGRGIAVVGPVDGGRIRPDGQQVAWRILRSADEESLLPFLIDDQTDRALRVPNGSAEVHPAGFTAVAGLVIAVPDLDAAAANYAAYLGSAGEETTPSIGGASGARRFSLGDQWLEIVQPANAESPLKETVDLHGGGPVEIVLRAPAGPDQEFLPANLTHGVRIRIVK